MPGAEPRPVEPDRAPAWLAAARLAVDQALAERLPAIPASAGDDARLAEAMRYATLGPGKRLRPAMVLAAHRAAGGDEADAELVGAACAVELIHAYSLVHDDLPAMDDDDLRRGRPTVHRAFDEATAILVGDALLTHAFAVLAEEGLCRRRERDYLAATAMLAYEAGAAGLVLGQALDLATPAGELGGDRLERIQIGKTGALFAAAAQLGGFAAGAGQDALATLRAFGLAYGVAFQYADDLADGDRGAARDRLAARLGEARDLAGRFGARGDRLLDLCLLLETST